MKEDFKQKIDREIEKTSKEQIKFLQRLVQTKSVNPYMDKPDKSNPYNSVELEVAQLIFNKLKEFGYSPKFEGISHSRPNVVCEIGSGEKTLVFNGHMDTVPPPKGYTFNPFIGIITGGKLHGVGSLDMKAALACYVYMAKAFSKYEKELKGKICLQFVIDEEPMASSPFGTQYLLEKGYTGHAAIIGEPGSHKITIGNRGGYRFKIEVFGEAVHTGSREWEQNKVGKSAITEMSRVIESLQNFEFPVTAHRIFPGRKSLSTFPTLITGGKSINIVPDSCIAFGDMRLLPGVTQKYIESQIKEKLDKLDLDYKLTTLTYVPSVFIEPEEEIVKTLFKNSRRVLNTDPIVEGSGPWSDMWMFIDKGIPAINFGCDGEGMHGKNEYVEIKSVVDVTKIYAFTAIDFF